MASAINNNPKEDDTAAASGDRALRQRVRGFVEDWRVTLGKHRQPERADALTITWDPINLVAGLSACYFLVALGRFAPAPMNSTRRNRNAVQSSSMAIWRTVSKPARRIESQPVSRLNSH